MQKYSFIGNRSLELIGDTALALFNKSITIPFLDKKLNRILEKIMDKMTLKYTKPNWFKFQ